MSNLPTIGSLLNASQSFNAGQSLAQQSINSRLNRDVAEQRMNLENRQMALQEQQFAQKLQAQLAEQELAEQLRINPEKALPLIYRKDPSKAKALADGLQNEYQTKYQVGTSLLKTDAKNKQFYYERALPTLQEMFPNIQFGDVYDSQTGKQLEAELKLTKARINTVYNLQETARGLENYNTVTGDLTPTGIGGQPTANSSPAAVREFEYFEKLAPEKKAQYLNVKRNTVGEGLGFDAQGNVVPLQGYLSNKGEIEASTELAQKLGDKQAAALDDLRVKAEEAQQSLVSIDNAEKLLDEGVTTGFGANFRVGFGKALKEVGFNVNEDEIANTEAYAANAANQVASYIQAFGAGTGLSDKDREFATDMAAGNVDLSEKSMRRIIEINKKAAKNIISKYKGRRSALPKNLQGYLPELTVNTPVREQVNQESVVEENFNNNLSDPLGIR